MFPAPWRGATLVKQEEDGRMGLLGSLFTRRSVPLREPRDTTDDALNAVFVPLRNRVLRFQRHYQYELGINSTRNSKNFNQAFYSSTWTSIHATIFGDYDKQNGEGARHCPERRSQH